jgi:hypothetical protein
VSAKLGGLSTGDSRKKAPAFGRDRREPLPPGPAGPVGPAGSDGRAVKRIRHGSRVWYVAVGVGAGVCVAALADGPWSGVRGLALAAAPLAGVALGVWARRDRCSVCRASLPLRVLDVSCPSCGRSLVAIVDGDRHLDIPAPSAPAPPGDTPETTSPYRDAGVIAARDAADAAERLRTRTDVDARVKRLREEPDIAEALREGDEGRLYALVRKRRRKATSIAEEAALDSFLADPRRRLSSKRSPWLGVRAGTGLLLSDPRDADPEDGSFVADQLLVVGTYSVAPLAAYLVRRRQDGGVDVLGGVPLSFLKRVWRAAVAIPVVAALALGGQAFVATLSSKVHLLNGLDVPVTVRVGGESVKLGPGARAVRVLSRGKQHLVTTDAKGTTIDEEDVDVPGGEALVVYDVVGAAPLLLRELFYSKSGRTPADLHAEQLLMGQRVLVHDNVGYPFVDAPQRIALNGELRTWQVTQLAGSWHGAVREHGWLPETVALVERVWRAEPEDEEAASAVVEAIAERDGIEKARAFVAERAAKAPSSPATLAAAASLGRREQGTPPPAP